MNAEQTPRIYSKDERSRMNRARNGSDHALLFEGADYDDDHLVVTNAQIDEIKRQYEPRHQDAVDATPIQGVVELAPTVTGEPIHDIGETAVQIVMLHNPVVEAVHRDAEKSIDELSQERENLNTLHDQLYELVEPYNASLYTDKIPADKTWRGRISSKPLATEPWFDDKLVGNFDATFRTTVYYNQGDDKNTLNKVSIRAKKRGDQEPKRGREDLEPMLDLNYSPEGKVTSMEFRQLGMNTATYKAMLSPFAKRQNSAGQVTHMIVRPDEITDMQVKVEIDGVPKISIGQKDFQSDKIHPICEYRYEADQDKFILYARDPKHRPESLSTVAYLGLVKGMLDFVPSTKVSV